MSLEWGSWTQGPHLITERYSHGCGRFRSAAHHGRHVVIVAGGYNSDGHLNSTEILDLDTDQWTVGKKLGMQ
jgi:hypothetical protein